MAGSGGGAMALTDPMVDPRGGALTVGLGLVEGVAVVPHLGDVDQDAHGEKLHRSVALAPPGLPVAGIPVRTALLRERACGLPGGARGPGVSVYVDGALADLSLFDSDRLDDDPLGRGARPGPQGVDGRHHVAALHHRPEEGVLRRAGRRRRGR